MSDRNMNFNSTQHPPVVPPNACPVCGEPMRRYYQPGIGPVSGSWQEHCTNRPCILYFVTLAAGTHARLTKEQLDAYRLMRSDDLDKQHEAITPEEAELYEAARLLRCIERLQLFGECG